MEEAVALGGHQRDSVLMAGARCGYGPWNCRRNSARRRRFMTHGSSPPRTTGHQYVGLRPVEPLHVRRASPRRVSRLGPAATAAWSKGLVVCGDLALGAIDGD